MDEIIINGIVTCVLYGIAAISTIMLIISAFCRQTQRMKPKHERKTFDYDIEKYRANTLGSDIKQKNG